MKYKVWDDKLKSFLTSEFYFLDESGKLHYMDKQSNRLFIIHADTCSEWIKPIFSTGIHDKNGVELFDGDYIDLCQNDFPGEHHIKKIIFAGGAWRTKGALQKDEHPELLSPLCDTLRLDYVKIGNKFENPELLEE